MTTVMDSARDSMKKNPTRDSCLDSQLWHACAGSMVQIPQINSKVFYFPQGHLEHAKGYVDLSNFNIPSMIPCRVTAIKFMADTETDEVYAKIRLIALKSNGFDDFEDVGFGGNRGIYSDCSENSASFAKTLTQSDANIGGGFSVLRYCAETIFPRLDYSAEPPVQTILAKDVHGEVWKFRHIYRGNPRRHLLTTGWSDFVNQKKLVAGDSIVFLRADNGDLCVGIRRARKGGIGGGSDNLVGWNSGGGNCGFPFGGYSGYPREDENKSSGRNSSCDLTGRVRAESVAEAATLAAKGQEVEVVYNPRASTSEFVVKASAVRAAMQIQWCSGMRFKMAFETENSSRISWLMGTISSVQVSDPIRWPNSPWNLLQVAWDEPDLLQNVKRVSPWLVELVSNIPAIHLSPFSPPRKKLRLPEQPEFSLINQLPMPSFSRNPLVTNSPLSCISDNTPAGIQGPRHAQYRQSSSDLHFNKLQSSLFPLGFQKQLERTTRNARIPSASLMSEIRNSENISCLLTMGNPTWSFKDNNDVKTPHILLFGKLILPQQNSCQSFYGDTVVNSLSEKTTISFDGSGSSSAVHQNVQLENYSDEGTPWCKAHQKSDLGLETGHCNVFMESEDVGETLDLSILGS